MTSVENEPNPGEIARRVKGTFTVPCFLFPSCAPGGTMLLNGEGNPIENGVWTANFDCIIPTSATTGAGESARPSLYGHGLFGRRQRGRLGPAAQPVAGARHRAVRDRRDRHVRIGRRLGGRSAPEPVRVPEDHRPPPAGAARRALPRAADDQPERLHDQRSLPPGRHAVDAVGARHQPPLLQRQQPGRDHGRRADGDLAGLHARVARRARR